MLLQEQVTENTQSSPVEGNVLPPTTRELAQAIVAVEGREGIPSHPAGDTNLAAQTLECLGLDIVPEELLAEVQELRVKANQEAVMTKRKSLDRTALALLAGMVAASSLSLFLVYTNYLMYFKVIEMNRDLQRNNAQSAINRLGVVSPQQLIAQWTFPGAQIHSTSTGSSMASSSMTTNASYNDVRKYYAAQAGYGKSYARLPSALGKNGELPPIMSSTWTTNEGGQSVTCKMQSSIAGGNPITLFTKHDGPNTVTVMIQGMAGKNGVEITVDAMNAW